MIAEDDEKDYNKLMRIVQRWMTTRVEDNPTQANFDVGWMAGYAQQLEAEVVRLKRQIAELKESK